MKKINTFDFPNIAKKWLISLINYLKIDINFRNLIFELEEDLLKTIIGLKKESDIKSNLEKIIYLVLVLRNSLGFSLNIIKTTNKYLLINESTLVNKELNISLKDCLYNELKVVYKNSFNKITNLAILTYNKPINLNKCLTEYINNIVNFGHKSINIIIFDDSNNGFKKENKAIFELFLNKYKNLIYIGRPEKINYLAKNSLNLNENELDYLFGLKEYPSSYSRNRNFIAYYFKNEAYISVDDDSEPYTLMPKELKLKYIIKKLIDNEFFSLEEINRLLESSNDYQKIPVDFINSFNGNKLEFVKYSGSKDYQLDQYLLKKIRNSELESLELLFKKNNNKEYIRGLVSYFPKDSFKNTITIPESYRVEDLLIGVNYYFHNKEKPIENKLSVYHDNFFRSITAKKLFDELIGCIIYSIYVNILQTKSSCLIEAINNVVEYSFPLSEKVFEDIYERGESIRIKLNNELIKLNKSDKSYKELKLILEKYKKYYDLFNQDNYRYDLNKKISDMFLKYSNILEKIFLKN